VILLAAGWVLPVGAPPIRNGRVAVEGGRVAWVGPSEDSSAPDGAVHFLGPGVLMPGLVNAHCHLELSYLRGRLPRGAGFVPWIESVVLARGSASGEQVAAATAAGVAELKQCGTVAVADVSNTLGSVAALRAARLRAVVLHELLAWDPAAAEPAFIAGRARMPEAADQVDVRLAAHAPHSVSRKLFGMLVAEGGPAALHLAESPDEVSFLHDGNGAWGAFLERRGLGHVRFTPPRQSPVAYADAMGALHPHLIAAHCVQTDPSDLETLARRRVHVAVCPRSNVNLGVGLPPLPQMLEAGVRVCVGTDSLASVDTLNVLDDVAALHEAFPAVPPRTLVEIATRNGAAALGLSEVGAIAPGLAAALAYAPSATPPDDPEAFVVSGRARLRPVAA
jgi:cytosine/adenosine deaminase-related metal-dependent hydrolase